jgi:hypothetical protein
MFCPTCGVRQPDDLRFCFACGARLPRELIDRRGPKESRWFLGIPVLPRDPPRGALRVSRYLEEFEASTPEGSVLVPSHHVRFSVWVDDVVVSAISLPDDAATNLGEFLLAEVRSESASTQATSPR